MYASFFKRLLDLLISLLALLILSPVFLITGLILSIANKENPFFLQPRPGRDEKIFKIIKFKTMNDKKDGHGNLLSDGERITPVGLFVRKTSLDEIPQLLNVIKGDMSIVGPRPLRVRYLPYYTTEERLRHSIRPGITGLAQVSGRNTLNWDDRLALDITYVKTLSFKEDVIILYKTFLKVIKSDDVVIDQSAIMPDLDTYRSHKIKA